MNPLDFKISCSGLTEALKQNGDKYSNIQESKSLLIVYEEKLLVWNAAGSCVLAFDLVYPDGSNTYKSLLPTCPPVFEVECLLLNRTNTLLALYGRKGLMVMQLPRLTSTRTSQQNNTFCRSWHIAERFFISANDISLLQVSWHPGSNTSVHLVVLSTDNYLRIYDATDSQTPIKVICLNQGKSYLSSEFRVSFPECYGETPVSFDFGPVESAKSSYSSNKHGASADSNVIHPIYVLNVNGDVYCVKTGLEKNGARCINNIEGPLPMYPPAEDNYGTDACALLCLHSTVPMLVIATASGILYHCIVLDNSGNEASNGSHESSISGDFSNPECDKALYVHGSIELPVSSMNNGTEDSFTHPVRLYKDVSYQNKYYCSLMCGVYTVAIPFIQKLDECLSRGDVENLSSLVMHNDSIVEHLLCTKPLASVGAVPVLGLACSVGNNGLSLICLLASWDIQCLPLLSLYCSKGAPLLSCDGSSVPSNDMKQEASESFESHIRRLLQRSTCTPILKIPQLADDSDSSVYYQQWHALILSTIARLQKEYIDRLCVVHSAIQSRVKILAERKVQQMAELDMCMLEKEQLRNSAEALAEKYDDVHVNQQKLLQRIEKVLKQLQNQYPILSTAEVNMKHTLTTSEDEIKIFQSSLDQIKKKLKYLNEQLHEKECSTAIDGLRGKLQGLNLGETQLKHVKEILYQEGLHVSDLVKNVTMLRKEAGL